MEMNERVHIDLVPYTRQPVESRAAGCTKACIVTSLINWAVCLNYWS